MQAGWQNFTVDDAVAVETATSLFRLGMAKSDARDVIDAYFDLAIDWLTAGECTDSVYIGMASIVEVGGADIAEEQHWLIGSTKDIEDEIKRLEAALGHNYFVSGERKIDLRFCVAQVLRRAANAKFEDPRLYELAHLFSLAVNGLKT